MSTKTKAKASEKLTETIKGRVEPTFKKQVADFCERMERTESFIVRKAVEEFIERKPA